jgi:hypothetical protein
MLFVAVSALLVAAAIALRSPADSSPPTAAVRPARVDGDPVGPARAVVVELNRRHADVKAAAARFLPAFLRYEVGDLNAAVRRALRASATRPFADRLLRHPPRPASAGRFPPRARLRRIDIAFVSPQATSAVVSGSARRGDLPEEFSFVFVRRRGTWLAGGPGE